MCAVVPAKSPRAGCRRPPPGARSAAAPAIASLLLLAGLFLLVACAGDGAAPGGPAAAERPAKGSAAAGPVFAERAAETGLDFVHFNGMSGRLYLAEITCGGGALADLDGDGDLDALLLQGRMVGDHPLEEASVPPRYPVPLTPRLYRNDLAESGELRFTDVTESAGLPAGDYGCAVAVGDADGDGRSDLYLANLGPNRLLENLGGLRFEDVTARAGVGDPSSGVTASFFDYDRDGRLDLFVGNNMAFDNSGRTVCRSLTGAQDYCGPGAYPSQPDRLYRNLGGGRFEDATAASGLASAPARPTLGSVAADLDRDGWVDLYVANDGQPNNLWLNRGDGTFEDRAMLAGAAVNAAGASEASMGVDAGDFDGDGDDDLILAHLVKETNTLYVNDGRGGFTDASSVSGLGPPSLPYTGFGAGWLDYDNDGWLDLLVVNGAVTLVPEQVAAGDPFPLHQRNQLFRNLGRGANGPAANGTVRFEEVTERAGQAFEASEVSRGTAFGDVDNDGDTDALVINNAGPARLLVNLVGQDRPWIGLRLLTEDAEGGLRDAPGARAALLWAGEPGAWRRVRLDGSYNSASDPRLLFALGDRPPPDGVRVWWPDGTVEDFAAPDAGRYATLRSGGGAAAP